MLINSEILEIEDENTFKTYLLASKPIIGFYSCRILHFKKDYAELSKYRSFNNFMIEDLTMYFYDNLKNLAMRRKRVGVKPIMKDIFDKSSFNKYRFMLDDYDQYVMNKNDEI